MPSLTAGISSFNLMTATFLISIIVNDVGGTYPGKVTIFAALKTPSFPEIAGIVTVTFVAKPSEQLFCEIYYN